MRLYKSEVYRSERSKKKMQKNYIEQLNEISVYHKECYVMTRYGKTHVVIYGNPKGIPVLTFHGGNASNPGFAAYTIPKLDTEHLKFIVPDTIGEIGFSAEKRFRGDELGYGYWASDVMKGLGLKKVICFGVSQGAGMAIRLCSIAPQKVEKLILMVPSGIANASVMYTLSKMAPPFFHFLLQPTKENRAKIMSPFLDERNDEFTEYMKLSFLNTHFQLHMPRNAKKEELEGFSAPVYVMAGEKDVIFPGRNVLRRSKMIFPNLQKAILMKGYKHGDMLMTTKEYTKYFKAVSRICLSK